MLNSYHCAIENRPTLCHNSFSTNEFTLDDLEDHHYSAYCAFRRIFREWEVANAFTFELVGTIVLGYAGEDRIVFQYCPTERCWEEPYGEEEFAIVASNEMLH